MAHARTTDSDKVKLGETAWTKDGHVLILAERTARGWKRLRVIVIDYWGSHEPHASEKPPLKGVFKIPPMTRLLTKKRVQAILDAYGLKA